MENCMSWVTVAQTESRKSLDKCLAYCTWSRNSQHRAFVWGVSSAGCRILHLKTSWLSFNSGILYYLLLEIPFVTHFTVPLGREMNGSGEDKDIYGPQLSKTSKYFKHFPTSLWVIPQPTQCIVLLPRYRTICHKAASCQTIFPYSLKSPVVLSGLNVKYLWMVDKMAPWIMGLTGLAEFDVQNSQKSGQRTIQPSLLLTSIHSLQHVSPPPRTH